LVWRCLRTKAKVVAGAPKTRGMGTQSRGGTVKGRKLDIRGKCPLGLAGYDTTQMPIARVVRGQLLGWPPETLRGLVP